MTEASYQKHIIERLKQEYPGCLVIKNDANYIQGIPDLLCLIGDKWLMLEVKISRLANHQPNQDYYVDKLNDMSFAAFIYPENEEDIFNGIQQTLRLNR